MPYVEGESLRDRLEREVQLPVEEAVRITREVADALRLRAPARGRAPGHQARQHPAHARPRACGRLRHRQGGQQRRGRDADRDRHGGRHAGLHVSRAGEPGARSTDAATSTASGAYSMRCSRASRRSPDRAPQAIIARHCAEPPRSMRVVRPGVPLAVERAVERALAKVPADRFQTAGEFARSLATPEVRLDRRRRSGWLSARTRIDLDCTAKPVRHRRAPLATLAIGVLLGLGVFLAWLRTRPDAGAAGPKRLAVLPFENLGRPEDEYFADGITDEVRGKLAELPGLEVIARTSSVQYKKTTKSPQQIGQELGVQYLLTGTVRWEKQAGGQSRVRVSPELVQVATALDQVAAALRGLAHRRVSGAGRHRGAGRAGARRRPRRGQRAQLAERRHRTWQRTMPTCVASRRPAVTPLADPVALRGARDYYQQAVALDSSFAVAWAQLSRTYSYLSTGTPRTAQRRRRLAARLSVRWRSRPSVPTVTWPSASTTKRCGGTHHARSSSTRWGGSSPPGTPGSWPSPGGAEFLLGRVEEGLADMREAEVLDPRSVDIAQSLTWPLLSSRRYAEAVATAERARALAPSNLLVIAVVVWAHLAQGDTARARGVLRAVPG